VRAVALAIALLAMTRVVFAASDEGSEHLRLEYVAGRGCPDRQGFVDLIRARTYRENFATDDASARVFEVVMDPGPPATGQVSIRLGQVPQGERHVQASTCSDVANALALVVALAVDPSALLATPPSSSASAPTATSPSASPPPPVPEPAPVSIARAPLLAPGSPTPAGHADAPLAVDSTTSTPRLPSTLSLGTDLAIAGGVVPAAIVGVSPHVGWVSSRAATVVPSARLAFLRAGTGILDVPGGSAIFEWTVAMLDACATHRSSNDSTRISACARVEGGTIDTSGIGIAAPRAQSSAWIAAGALLRGEWAIVQPMFVEGALAAMAHPIVHRFYFLPDTTAYQVPVLGWSGSVGVGVHFL
jgi:hypothetical protein